MHLPFVDFAAVTPGWLVLTALLVAIVAATRLPVVGGVVRGAVTVAIVALLVFVLAERERFDPYLGRIAGVFQLDRQEVSGRELRVRLSPDGHFWVWAKINGVERRLLIDSGATVTALSAETARAARLKLGRGLVPILLNTANGTIRADGATLDELRLGNIVARRLAVVVSPAFDQDGRAGDELPVAARQLARRRTHAGAGTASPAGRDERLNREDLKRERAPVLPDAPPRSPIRSGGGRGDRPSNDGRRDYGNGDGCGCCRGSREPLHLDRADRRAFADPQTGDDRTRDRAAGRADAGAAEDATGALGHDRRRAHTERDHGSPNQLRHDVLLG